MSDNLWWCADCNNVADVHLCTRCYFERVLKAMRLLMMANEHKAQETITKDDPLFKLAHGLTCENFGQKNPYDQRKDEGDVDTNTSR